VQRTPRRRASRQAQVDAAQAHGVGFLLDARGTLGVSPAPLCHRLRLGKRGSGGSARMIDIAARVHAHNWKIYPIVRSVLDFPKAASEWPGAMKVVGYFYSNPDKNDRYKVGGLPVADNFAGLVGSRRFEEVPKSARVAQIAGAQWGSLLTFIANKMAEQGVTS
jgi:hypothetical protein